MEGSSTKLAFLLLILANASVLVPLTGEARCDKDKRARGHHHHHHHQRPHYPPTFPSSPAPMPLSPAPTPTPSDVPPYQIHGCGFNCSDSNDCDWPCTVCCANQTCCYDEPMALSPQVIQEPASAPIAVYPPPVDPSTVPQVPYQIHGCGYPCSDSNDCDWPCTMCCYYSNKNHTCCYEDPFPE